MPYVLEASALGLLTGMPEPISYLISDVISNISVDIIHILLIPWEDWDFSYGTLTSLREEDAWVLPISAEGYCPRQVLTDSLPSLDTRVRTLVHRLPP